MNRLVLGAVLALALLGIGLFWLQGRAEVEQGAPPPLPEPLASDTSLPVADVSDMEGPAPPEARELTREQKRFARYDRNSDGVISRNEMLSTRTEGFRKLDKDGNNLLSFEEWAVTTVDRFEKADANHDGILTRAEFATTRPKQSKTKNRSRCRC